MQTNSHYTPTENGFSICGSSELFNRTLYGSHKNDDKEARFCTFAGDAPQFMGAVTDWVENTYSFYSKCGTLTSGLALTPGQRVGFFYSGDMDISSRFDRYNLYEISVGIPDREKYRSRPHYLRLSRGSARS